MTVDRKLRARDPLQRRGRHRVGLLFSNIILRLASAFFSRSKLNSFQVPLLSSCNEFWREELFYYLFCCLVLFNYQGQRKTCEQRNITYEKFTVPRKAVKRPAEKPAVNTAAKKSKNNGGRKKDEPIEYPDLRHLEKGRGYVLTFGQGDVGQLGLGEDVMEKKRPALLETDSNIISIAAGGMHTILLTDKGKVITFGCNDEGALGRDTSQEGTEFVPGEVNLPGKVIQITAGDSHSAALLEDGRVYAWGSFRDSHGSMGLTTGTNEKVPIELLPSVKIIKLASGADHLVLLSEDGKVYSGGCAEQGQLGRVPLRSADRGNRHGVQTLLEPDLVKFSPRVKTKFDNVWAGSFCTFVKDVKNKIYVFGLNNYHQIGLDNPGTQFFPTPSKTLSGKKLVHISSSQHHTMALDEDGKVFVLGRKEYGRLGLGPDCDDATVLTQVGDLSKMKCIDVGTGSAQSFAVTDSGDLYSWGMGTNGQLGNGSEDDVLSPLLVKGKQLEGKSVVRVSGGGQHTVILATESKMNSHNSVK